MKLGTILLFGIILSFMAVVPPAAGQEEPEGVQEQQSSCVSCHLEMGEELAVPVEGMKNDVHAQQGLSCADCHGGDPKAGFDGDMEAAMDPAKGYIGVPDRTEIPKFCARCHSDPDFMRQYNPRVATDQYERYKTSMHGKLLAKGDDKVATCIDCHGVHGIRPADDARSPVYAMNIPETCAQCHADPEYMAGYDIPTNQVAAYKSSVHGKALLDQGDQAAPACNDCHGNHGANPPGAPSIAYICGQCHLYNAELFLKSPHKTAFDDMGLPECETCHGNHAIKPPTDEMLGTGPQSVCTDCHEPDSKGYLAGVTMRLQIDNLKWLINQADSLLSVAERAGMEVSEPKFELNEADDALIKARTMIHSLSAERVKEVIDQGMTKAKEAVAAGQQALKDLQFRRKGLAISTIFILLLAWGLYMKIKDVDRKKMLSSESSKS
jgi:cytochrome c553